MQVNSLLQNISLLHKGSRTKKVLLLPPPPPLNGPDIKRRTFFAASLS